MIVDTRYFTIVNEKLSPLSYHVLQNTSPSHQPSRGDKTRESLDLSHSNEAYNIDTHHQKVRLLFVYADLLLYINAVVFSIFSMFMIVLRMQSIIHCRIFQVHLPPAHLTFCHTERDPRCCA